MYGIFKSVLNETYDTVRVGKHLSDTFPIKNGLKQGDALTPLLLKFALDMPLGGLRQIRSSCSRRYTSASGFR
jgi:hypothetical protein